MWFPVSLCDYECACGLEWKVKFIHFMSVRVSHVHDLHLLLSVY